MATTPPYGDSEEPAARWTGRASVPAAPARVAAGSTHRAAAPPVSPARVAPPAYPPPGPAKPRLKPRWGRIAAVSALAVLLVVGIAGFVVFNWISGVDDNLKRTDPFADVAGRPAKAVDGTLNILLLGSDSRDPDAPTDTAGKWRTDTMVLMHIPASHDRAYFISFPRDLWVYVPKSKDGQYGETMAKLNAAYSWGGLPLMVQTLEGYTGIRMDHVALIDFGGFKRVTDALGGVDMNVERTITSIHKPHRTFTKGVHHFNGAEALDYVRQRYQFPDGDFARMRHQQEFLKAIMDKAVSAGTVTSPGRLKEFVSSVADAITVDKDFSLLDLGWQFRNLRSNDMVFLTSPHKGTADIDGQSVVLSDKEKALSLFDAIQKDTTATWYGQHNPSPSPNANGG
ncbi:MAG TPA: LCP family protein [Micromonosporaceae bacterium]